MQSTDQLNVPEDDSDYGEEQEQGSYGLYKDQGTLGARPVEQSARAKRPIDQGGEGARGFCGTGKERCFIF